MTNPLEYKEIALPDDCVFKISPSKFADFITHPHRWYRSEISKEDVFTYNTSSVIGTIVHYCAEMVAKGEIVDQNAIDEYINSKEPSDEYDPEVVRAHYVDMAETLVNDYVLHNTFFKVEEQFLTEIRDGYYAGGTSDALQGDQDDCMIVDYKSYNSKTKPRAFPAGYKYQLLVYAYILRKLGYNVTRLRLVFINRNIEGEISEKTGKRLKSYPPEVTVLTESVTEEDFDFIEGLLELSVDTVQHHKKHPELAHITWHDPRLRPQE